MMIINKYTILSVLCLVLLALTGIYCAPQPIPSPPIPQPPATPPHDTTPPDTLITKAPNGTINYNEVAFQWTGSDDTSPTSSLTYSFYLESHESDYSPFTRDTAKTYTDLPDGTYTFYVKSRDEAGNINPTPATVKFTIAISTPEEKPQAVTPIVSPLLIAPNSDVSQIAVGYDNTIYALDSTNAKLYKSDQGGYGWTDISRGLAAAPTWIYPGHSSR